MLRPDQSRGLVTGELAGDKRPSGLQQGRVVHRVADHHEFQRQRPRGGILRAGQQRVEPLLQPDRPDDGDASRDRADAAPTAAAARVHPPRG